MVLVEGAMLGGGKGSQAGPPQNPHTPFQPPRTPLPAAQTLPPPPAPQNPHPPHTLMFLIPQTQPQPPQTPQNPRSASLKPLPDLPKPPGPPWRGRSPVGSTCWCPCVRPGGKSGGHGVAAMSPRCHHEVTAVVPAPLRWPRLHSPWSRVTGAAGPAPAGPGGGEGITGEPPLRTGRR